MYCFQAGGRLQSYGFMDSNTCTVCSTVHIIHQPIFKDAFLLALTSPSLIINLAGLQDIGDDRTFFLRTLKEMKLYLFIFQEWALCD